MCSAIVLAVVESLFHLQAPLIQTVIAVPCDLVPFWPVNPPSPSREIEQTIEIDIIHQRNPNHGGQSREAPSPFQLLLHDHKEQISITPSGA